MRQKSVKFLLVDDLEANLIALEGLLKRVGLELLKARSAHEALELLLVHDIALAILDVQMPEVDGFELAELMRGTEKTRRIPIIFLTAGGNDSQRRFRGYEAGAVDFLFKPIEPHILQSKAEVFFELARQREELREHALQLEQKVTERTAHLKEANAQLEAFCYTIAHDLRSPLRSQQGFAKILLDDYGDQLDDRGRDYAKRIISAAARLDCLVTDLLSYARISRTEVRLENIELHPLVTLIFDELAFQVREAAAEVKIDPFRFMIRGHLIILHTAITNLFLNALKFAKPAVPLRIHIWAEERDNAVRLWIEDNGIGIAPEFHRQIFEIFQRLHKSHEYSGTGVGLAIVQRGIERMGGRVGIESEVGQGSRFWIELDKVQPSDLPQTEKLL